MGRAAQVAKMTALVRQWRASGEPQARFAPSPVVRIYVVTGATDRSLDRLAAIVREHVQLDPLSGHWFLFRNRRGDRMKLPWDPDGAPACRRRGIGLLGLLQAARARDVRVAGRRCGHAGRSYLLLTAHRGCRSTGWQMPLAERARRAPSWAAREVQRRRRGAQSQYRSVSDHLLGLLGLPSPRPALTPRCLCLGRKGSSSYSQIEAPLTQAARTSDAASRRGQTGLDRAIGDY
jgi:hypothetical protein